MIHAIEKVDDEIFIVMEDIEGQELKKRIDAGAINVEEAIAIALQIADGMGAAHDKSIIHRDIKSSNIMITKSGQVNIMDFGLAKISGGIPLTKDIATLGTVKYMSGV